MWMEAGLRRVGRERASERLVCGRGFGLRGGRPGADGRRRGRKLVAAGLEFTELVEGAIPLAAGGLAAAEDLLEGVGAFAIPEECRTDGVPGGLVQLGDEGVEDLGFQAAHAALGPIGGDDLLDEERLLGADGLELAVVGSGEFGEGGFVFAGDDEGLCGSCVLQSIEAGDGLAFGGAGTGRLLRVEAIGGDLGQGSHT